MYRRYNACRRLFAINDNFFPTTNTSTAPYDNVTTDRSCENN